MAKKTYLFISEVSQNRKQILSGILSVNDETTKDYKKITQEEFQIIKPKSLPSNPDEWQGHLKKLADLELSVNVIFFSIRYERLDVMSFRLNNLMKYFKPYVENICLIISDFQKSQNKKPDYQTLYRKLANQFGIKLFYGYYKKENIDTFYHFSIREQEIGKSARFFQENKFKNNKKIVLDGNKMGVYPQIDHQLLSQLKYRFKSADPQINNKIEIDANPKFDGLSKKLVKIHFIRLPFNIPYTGINSKAQCSYYQQCPIKK